MMRTPTSPIVAGIDVQFESEDGIQVGKVAEIKADVTNGRRVAAVEVIGTLDNQPWHVPVDQLQPVAIG